MRYHKSLAAEKMIGDCCMSKSDERTVYLLKFGWALLIVPLAIGGCSSAPTAHSEFTSNSSRGEVSSEIPGDKKWAGPWSQQYLPDVKRPTRDLFNAKAQCGLPERKDVAVVQQSTSQEDAIKRALALCNVRCSDTGLGGCTIVKQFVAKLLPRVNGEPSEEYVCKMTENKPLTEPVKNRPWPGPPGKSVTEAIQKGEEYAHKKAAIEIQPVKCVNNDFDKSEILVDDAQYL
jgi:hypothetical protein